jgi:hypothetical protein
MMTIPWCKSKVKIPTTTPKGVKTDIDGEPNELFIDQNQDTH